MKDVLYIYIYMSERKFFLILSLLILGAVGKADTTPTNYELNQKIADLQREIEELKRKHANNYYVKIKGDVYDTTVNTPNDPADIGDLGVAGGLTNLQTGIAIGENMKVLKDNNVTLGSESIANTEKKVLGYNPYEMFNKTVSETDKNKFIVDKAADYNRIDAEITQLETQKMTLETELAAIEKQMETTYDTTEYYKLVRQ